MKLLRNEILYRESNILLEHHHADDWIYANWRGFQNFDSVVAGCEKILDFLQERQCTKVLNDNSNVEGIWSGAAKWVGQDWMPRMRAAGLECFAWVYSPSTFSRLSADKSLKYTDDVSYIKTFDDLDSASDWLRSC